MIEAYCRKPLQVWLFTPLAKLLSHIHGLSPCHITYTAGFTGVFSAICIALNRPVFAIVLLLLSGLCDVLDGSLARLHNSQSDDGCALDIITDRVVEAAILIGFYCQAPLSRALPTLLLMASILLCITSFLVVGLLGKTGNNNNGKSFQYSPGLIERAECFIAFIVMLIWPRSYYWMSLTLSVLIFFTAIRHYSQFKCALFFDAE